MGKRVARRFEGSDSQELVVHGVVERHLPAHGEEGALWHMRHDDGDEEDLDEQELEAALRLQQQCDLHDHTGGNTGGSVDSTELDRTATCRHKRARLLRCALAVPPAQWALVLQDSDGTP